MAHLVGKKWVSTSTFHMHLQIWQWVGAVAANFQHNMHFSSIINVSYVDMAMGGLVSDVDTILGYITRENVCSPGCRMQKLCRTYPGKISGPF